MKFRYKQYAPGVIRPVIPIEMRHNGQSFRCEVLVDSGADMNTANIEIAEILGIDVKAGIPGKVQGVTGGSEANWTHDITIVVGGHKRLVPVAFGEKVGHWGFQIVGQKGFFDLFNIKFSYQKSEVEIKPI
jgi:hypothetical protein